MISFLLLQIFKYNHYGHAVAQTLQNQRRFRGLGPHSLAPVVMLLANKYSRKKQPWAWHRDTDFNHAR